MILDTSAIVAVIFGQAEAAALNFGDCLTHTGAKLSGQALLCVGGDFPRPIPRWYR